GALSGEETTVVRGLVKRVRERRSRGGRSVLTARIEDGSGSLELVWFEQPYIAEWLRAGFFVTAYGDVRRRGGVLQIVAPEFEVEADDGDDADGPSLHLRRIVPIYALTRGIQQRFLRRLVDRVLSAAAELGDGPADLLRPGSPALADAYRDVHFPSTFDALEAARARLGFDDHFRFASALLFRRRRFRETGGASYAVSRELDQKIRSLFPFQLTKDQDGAIAEIVRDLGGPEPMYRLLQGDVGTGKTAVALYALLVAVRHGEQGCLMAPTEVLAEQHHRTLRRFLAKHPVRIELLSGSTRPSERDRILADLEAGKAHLIVGTHALLQDPVRFRKLGVAVIDEQHRFGVRDRKRLREKGDRPHVLIMTATPIPRSLCMTCYGDLDVSLLRNRPPGRQPVETRIVTAGKEKAALELVRSEVRRGRQAFFIYPLIDESEELAVPAATAGYERLSREVFPEFRVGLVHGRMSSAAKDEALEEFRANRIQILVATVVIEVGIDVPNATVLYIEDASRFGIAQLHQLRGRVGRGEHRGYCLVGQGSGGRETRERLRVFASTDDGFRL
ncbi:MAG TPA: ATP-dependent DNA helicase RecG, partial [Planctomycetota bacterium]|nr:ATP-dependent DNA helicase RecG [Planctomycetota bacterium]